MQSAQQLIFVIVLALAASCHATCPTIEALQVIQGETFICAHRWDQDGNAEPNLACNGADYLALDGAQASAEEGYYYPIGSLAVMPGCSFYEFEDYSYGGQVRIYEGPSIFPEYTGFVADPSDVDTTPGGARSFQCICQQKLIDCQPSDSFLLILSCDNTAGTSPVSCQYTQRAGTDYGAAAAANLGISQGVADAIMSGLADTYSEDIGISSSTGYDWTTASEDTFDVDVTVTVETIAEGGELVIVEQAQGSCGDNRTYADFFKITTSRAGQPDKITYHKLMPDGSLQEILKPF